jgi:large subunit ribosomal protein L24
MTNGRYVRKLKDLKGPAKKIAEDNMFKHNPPFLQAQINYTVREEERLKHAPFVEGDRVQVVSGKERGKVGTVHSVYKDGNCCFVEGLGGTTKMVLPRTMWLEGQSKPVTNVPNPIPYDNLRLVSTIKKEDGSTEDVAVHSIIFKGNYYDPDRNEKLPIRRAKHNPSMVIPYPVPPTPLKESNPEIATPASAVEERTFFPASLHDMPIKIGALDQIRNPHSKWRKHKDSRRITAKEADYYSPPKMPANPSTKKLLQELAKVPKPQRPEFNKEIEDFISQEIEKGLQKRASQETEALNNYK